MKLIVSSQEVVDAGLWKLYPAINCDYVSDIPNDYPGAIGVPITAMYKIGKNDGRSGLQIIDMARPKIGGKVLYQRLMIRNLHPEIPDSFDILEELDKLGVHVDVILEVIPPADEIKRGDA